jgi:hypothetical protein
VSKSLYISFIGDFLETFSIFLQDGFQFFDDWLREEYPNLGEAETLHGPLDGLQILRRERELLDRTASAIRDFIVEHNMPDTLLLAEVPVLLDNLQGWAYAPGA